MDIIKDYDNYMLPAGDLEAAKDFYQNKLGLAVKFDFSDRGMVAFKVGDNEPAIILRKADQAQPCLMLVVDDVRAAYTVLQQRGVVFLTEPFAIGTGLMVQFKDPSGNLFALTDYSKMPKQQP